MAGRPRLAGHAAPARLIVNDDLHPRAIDVFEDVIDQPEEARLAWLHAHFPRDPRLVSDVKRLLDADRAASQAFPTNGAGFLGLVRPPPNRVGQYKIDRKLGEGGMGEVYLGIRDDGLFEHRAAVKLVRPTLMPQIAVKQFEQERRTLARLTHRSIAQLFDGGVCDDDTPYLIMEYVRGEPIDADFVRRNPDVRSIVETMILVCAAVEYAHQNLVVHADLKPSNILVNDAGEPKIVDFGVAGLLSQGSAEEGRAPLAFTPGFSSPERAAGSPPAPGDDVFSIGVVLKVLLTGGQPGSSVWSSPVTDIVAAANPDRSQRWIRDRQRAIRGDLACIINRATAASARDRYRSVEALTRDLHAWLTLRPIAEKRHDRLYAAAMLYRRRRLRFIFGGLAIAGLVIAAVVSMSLYLQADRQRRLAESRFDDVRSLARFLLFDAYDRAEAIPRTLALRRDMAELGQRYLDVLAADGQAPEDVRLDAIEGLVRIAELQAGVGRISLGDFEVARRNLSQAEAIARALPAGKNVRLTSLNARIALNRAIVAMNVDQDIFEAGKQLERATAYLLALAPQARLPMTREIQVQRAVLANWDGKYAEAEALARQLAPRAEDPPDGAEDLATRLQRLRALDALAESIYYRDDMSGAIREYSRLVSYAADLLGQNPENGEALRQTARARWSLATTFMNAGQIEPALNELAKARVLVDELVDREPADEQGLRLQNIIVTAQAQALAMSGRFDEGAKMLAQEIERRRQRYLSNVDRSDIARNYAVALAMLADLNIEHHRNAVACKLLGDATRVFDALRTRKRLSNQDETGALRLVRESQKRADCR